MLRNFRKGPQRSLDRHRVRKQVGNLRVDDNNVGLVRSRSTYFPRTNAPKSERLYSERSSSAASDLAFLIELPLCPRCVASGDDSNDVVMLDVRDHEQVP